jgi:hypothetical protein
MRRARTAAHDMVEPGMYFIKVSDVDGKMVMTFVKG